MEYSTEFDQDNDDGGPTEVPFCPGNSRGIDSNAVPRYLFRVFTKETAGWNSSKWMKSAASLHTTVKDIFTREDTGDVARALNAYLREDSMPIQECAFITWTASLVIALQFAILKSKRESLQLADVYLCVVDAAMFPPGTFISDIVLMEAFQSPIPEHDTIRYDGFQLPLCDCGLATMHQMRTSSNGNDLAMYLAQGRLRIMDRSAVLSCDKIINNDLLLVAPIFNYTFSDRKFSLDHTIIAFRVLFTHKTPELITSGEGLAALRIAKKFPTRWRNMMMAGLLALRPRPKDDPGCIPFDIASLQGQWSHIRAMRLYSQLTVYRGIALSALGQMEPFTWPI
ncbi:hypothetical protein G7054_g11015 [Neopestalotiopsis clavispora]|nr:hypothetical protein G7054_g11015 [Neopestalotiopsis clavispora]